MNREVALTAGARGARMHPMRAREEAGQRARRRSTVRDRARPRAAQPWARRAGLVNADVRHHDV